MTQDELAARRPPDNVTCDECGGQWWEVGPVVIADGHVVGHASHGMTCRSCRAHRPSALFAGPIVPRGDLPPIHP